MGIRRATYEETMHIRQHALAVMKESTGGHIEPSWEKVRLVTAPFIESGGYYLVFTESRMICGWAGVATILDLDTERMAGLIAELYVMPAHRGKGIGEKLCKEAIRILRKQGFEKVQLNVYSGNPAKYLYEKLGFSDVSTMMEVKARDLD